MTFSIKKIDTATERRIACGCIVSKEYLYNIKPILNLNYFKNEYIRLIVSECVDFYNNYEDSPFDDINQLLLKDKQKRTKEESEIIEELLKDLHSRYEKNKGINVEFLTKETVDYFKQRELEITAGNIKFHLEKGDIVEAEKEALNYKVVAKQNSTWINPFEQKEIQEVFDKRRNPFFKLSGALGDYIGYMEKGWLVGIQGAYKRGKSFFCMDLAVEGIMAQKNTVYFALEMSATSIKERFYRRVTAYGDEDDYYTFPCFDCALNQNGFCKEPERTNWETLMDKGVLPEYSVDMTYKTCIACKPQSYTGTEWRNSKYKMALWKDSIHKPAFNYGSVSEWMTSFAAAYGRYFRIKVRPKGSTSLRDIKQELDILSKTEGFDAEIVIIDMADNINADDKRLQDTSKEDAVWQGLAGMAEERQILIFTPKHVTRDGQDAVKLRKVHTSKWIGVRGHVDVLIDLNQTPAEKDMGYLRVAISEHRHGEFSENVEAILLQQLNLGQPHLDSHLVYLTPE